MKAGERHHLKTNEFAIWVARVTELLATHRERVVMGTVAAVALIVGIAGYSWYRGNVAAKAETLIGAAMSTYDAPIVPAPSIPGAVQQPGTFPTELARAEAALAAFQKIIDTYPGTKAATTARYHHASALLSLGRMQEAATAFEAAAAAAGNSIYAPMARMGQAEALIGAGQFDPGVKLLETLAADRDGLLPVDGVLMRLAVAYEKAGKAAEAKTAYKRVVDEFPDSTYVSQAREELAKLG